MKLKSKKGFTLIELLAVIVILAILILLALPAVLNTMDRARKNAFVTEANTIARYAETRFAEEQLTGGGNSACYTLKSLYPDYSRKDFEKAGYSGIIEISPKSVGNGVDITLYISNGAYFIDGDTAIEISNSDYTLEATSISKLDC